MGEPTTRGATARSFDRLLAVALGLVLASALVAVPAIPYPGAFERHLAALAGCVALTVASLGFLVARPFPIPPLPAATLGLAGALAFTALLPEVIPYVYSPERAWITVGGAAGLVLMAAIARAVARAGLGAPLLWGACALGGTIAAISLLESLGLDPLGAAPFYDASRNPVATFGNPDPLVDFLAPVAAVATALAFGATGGRRAVALVAASASALALGVAGVLYGFVAFAIGLAVALRFASIRGERWLGRPLLIAVLLLGSMAGARALRPSMEAPVEPVAGPAAAAAAPSWPIPATLEVRVRIWVASAKLAFAFAPWGAGAGHFAIAFPPQRDPMEIELSSHRRTDPVETVVDHAHNEPIQLLVESGALGALVLVALFLGIRRWWKQGVFLASDPASAASAGLAAIAVAALAHAPLSDTASSAILAAILLGIVGAGDAASREHVPEWLGRPIAVGVLAALPFATYVAFTALQADLLVTAERVEPQAGADRLRRALPLAPTDEHVPLLLARRLRAEGDSRGALSAYREALRRRPFLVEAILNAGVILAEMGDFDGAAAAFNSCEAIDPTHPKLRYNRGQLALHRAEAARDAKKDRDAAELLDGAVTLGIPDRWLRDWGISLFEADAFDRAIPYLDRYATRHADEADVWHKLGTSFQKIGNLELAALDFARAHHLYALEHLRSANPDAAARSAKQYHHWARPDDAGPYVLDALIALESSKRDAAAAALAKAEEVSSRLDPGFPQRPEYAKLFADADLGPRARRLVK